jgi:hypothetical protein
VQLSFFFLKKKISSFIYFLINFFFIKMDTCCHIIGYTWRWRVELTDSVKMIDGKSTEGVKRNYCIAYESSMNFLNHKE